MPGSGHRRTSRAVSILAAVLEVPPGTVELVLEQGQQQAPWVETPSARRRTAVSIFMFFLYVFASSRFRV